MLGLGLTLGVLVDATLVRMVLVPAFIHLLGRWTWWAPQWSALLRNRSATGEGEAVAVGRGRWAADAPKLPVARRWPARAAPDRG
jgi:RND superfamily putative drug exporter